MVQNINERGGKMEINEKKGKEEGSERDGWKTV